MKFFFDMNIAKRLAMMLAGYEGEHHRIVHQDDDSRFRRDSEDTFIIGTLSSENPRPVFITGDLNMRRAKHPHERKALADSGLTLVFLRKTFNNLPVHEQALKLLRVWPEIVEATSACREPTTFEVNANGKLERLCLTEKL